MASANEPIDLAALHNRVLGNRSLMDDLLRLFVQHAPAVFNGARAALNGGDWVAARQAVHQLKGSAATIAATELARQLAGIEAAMRTGDAALAGTTMLAAETMLNACLAQITTRYQTSE